MNVRVNNDLIKERVRNLNKLVEKVCSFTYETYGCKYVIMCEGNISSNCICIAEAPGAMEELERRILVGKSGSIVRGILKKYGIEKKVMFLNVIPWRPPGNATPKTDDIVNYIVFWKELFKILNIECAVCLGSVSKKMMKFGEGFNIPEVLETWHPAYYLRTKNYEHFEDIDLKLLEMKHRVNCNNYFCYMHFVREIL